MKCNACGYEANDNYEQAEHAVHIHPDVIEGKLTYYGEFKIETLFSEEVGGSE